MTFLKLKQGYGVFKGSRDASGASLVAHYPRD